MGKAAEAAHMAARSAGQRALKSGCVRMKNDSNMRQKTTLVQKTWYADGGSTVRVGTTGV